MTPVTVRAASEDDYDAAGELCVLAYVAGGHLDPAHAYAGTLRDVRARVATTELIVAIQGDAMVGTVSICPTDSPWAEISRPGELEFRFLAVDPSAWRRGIGELLVDACERRAREQGASAMVISVIDRNEGAHRLYLRLGFERTPERDWVPVPGVNLLTYRRPVPFDR